jgi:ribosomal protein S27E|tara:strand:+ start:1068 stop:1250 length:183 start_codon:yes stop_codon:yes gene_type:complete
MYTITHNTKYVDKNTRAGAVGKQIICPLCFKWTTVYHFSWSAIACGVCHSNVEKQAWIIK